jgi:serine/threonine-protein kinase
VIGEGGMGAVVAAEHVELGGKVAIKFLHPHLAQEGEVHERFIREAKVAVQLRSEHVVRVLDAGKTPNGLPYIVMDLLEGADLGATISAGPLPIPLAVTCILQASEALAEAHAQGIVHRDIKPANLWLAQRRDGAPSVKVLDFGISKLIPNDRDAAGITDTKASFGSPAYMSPEQIRSAKRVDHRTDVWALGVVLFELLTTKLPFDADNVAGILAAIISDPPLPLRQLRPDAPPELERVIYAMLEKDPNRRVSLADVALALRPLSSHAGQLAADHILRTSAPAVPLVSLRPPPSSSEDIVALGKTEPSLVTQRPSTPRSALLTAVLLGLVIAVAAGGAGVVAVRRHRERPPEPPPADVRREPPPAPAAELVASVVPEPPALPPPSASAPRPSASTSAPAPSAKPGNAVKRPPPPAPPPKPAPASSSPFLDDRHW